MTAVPAMTPCRARRRSPSRMPANPGPGNSKLSGSASVRTTARRPPAPVPSPLFQAMSLPVSTPAANEMAARASRCTPGLAPASTVKAAKRDAEPRVLAWQALPDDGRGPAGRGAARARSHGPAPGRGRSGGPGGPVYERRRSRPIQRAMNSSAKRCRSNRSTRSVSLPKAGLGLHPLKGDLSDAVVATPARVPQAGLSHAVFSTSARRACGVRTPGGCGAGMPSAAGSGRRASAASTTLTAGPADSCIRPSRMPPS
jgi:hypothetical protein